MTMGQPLYFFFHLAPQQTLNSSITIIPIHGCRNRGMKQLKRLAPGHTANVMQNLDLNQGCSLEPKCFTILPHHFIYQMEKHIDDVKHFEICCPMQI